MKAIAYYRVSSREQQKRKTVASQKRIVHEFAKQMDYTLLEELEFKDDGKEGGEIDNRPGFQSTLQAIEDDRAQVLLVTFVNRIGRFKKLADRNRVVELLQDHQVNVHVPFPSPDGTLYKWDDEDDLETLRKQLWQSRKENIERGEMVRVGLEERRLRGAPVGKLPYGLLYEEAEDPEERGTYSYDPKKCATLKPIIKLLTDGWGLPTVAKTLNGDLEKYPPPESKGEWEETAILQIVHNDFYFTAHIHSTKDDIDPQPTGLAPLFTQEQIKTARREMSIRRKRSGILNRTDHLLHGLLQCGECGRSMGPHPSHRLVSGGIVWAYRCRGKNRYGPDFCSQRLFRKNELEESVWQTVLRMVESDLTEAIMAEEFIPDADRDKLRDLASKCEQDLTALQEQERRAKRLYVKGDYEDEEYEAEKSRIEKEQIEAEELHRKVVEQLERPVEKEAAIREAVEAVADQVRYLQLFEEWNEASAAFYRLPEAEQDRLEKEQEQRMDRGEPPYLPHTKLQWKVLEMEDEYWGEIRWLPSEYQPQGRIGVHIAEQHDRRQINELIRKMK
jgi:DNA invertase Pin-like site-specific DNA recombinase